jgi:hypothetical protein
MNKDEILDELSIVQDEINTLPKGYISKKKINGKIRYYLQWNENGKKHSKYIDESLLNDILKNIDRRKELKAKEEELKLLIKNYESKTKKKNIHNFKTNIILGKDLSQFVSKIKLWKKRNIYKNITDYLYDFNSDKVLVLYGLRRTGKTTLIKQAILNMNDFDKSKTAFIQANDKTTLSDINQDLKYLMNNDFKYIFIDEITLAEDFIQGAALFSDIFVSCGMKIVLSGTDSLGFYFSKDEQLYDRALFIHTTFIPYKEFEEVLGIKGIDEYICYGGTMSLGGINYNDSSIFSNKKKVDEYIDSAISKNIQHSLKFYQYGGHFRALYDLYEKNELTRAINRVVEDFNHQFTIDVLTKNFISHDLGISQRNLRNDRTNPNDTLDYINKDEFTNRLKQLLEIKNKDEQKVLILDEHKEQIKEYLDALDLTLDVEIESIPVNNKKNYKVLFTQPGIRYSQAKEFVKSLLLDEVFQNISIDEKSYIIDRILNEIKGRMLEDIVLLETKIAKRDKLVFKLQFDVGEFDMVVFDPINLNCKIYEIKHSKEQSIEQYRHLIDIDKIKKTEFRYGKILKKVILYRGENIILDNGIEYINVEDYLKEL